MADTGWIFPGSGEANSLYTKSSAFTGWGSAGNITANDGVLAGFNSDFENTDSDCLRGYNFGFNLPPGTIDGVEARYEARWTSGDQQPEQGEKAIQLINDSAALFGANKSNAVKWTTSFVVYTKGGASDLWSATITPAIVNDVDFGFGMQGTAYGEGATGQVDYYQMKIYYTPAPPSGSLLLGEFII